MAHAKKKAAAPPAPVLSVVPRAPLPFRCNGCGTGAEIAYPLGLDGRDGNCELCYTGVLVPLVPVMPERVDSLEDRIVGALPSVVGDPAGAFTVSDLVVEIEDGASRPGFTERTELVLVQAVVDRFEWWAEHINKLSVGAIQSFERELDQDLDDDLHIKLKPEVLAALDRWCFFRDRGDQPSPAQTRALEFLDEVEASSDRDLTSLDGAHELFKLLGLSTDTAARVMKQEARMRAELGRRADGPTTKTEMELENARLRRDLAESRVKELESQLAFYGIDPA